VTFTATVALAHSHRASLFRAALLLSTDDPVASPDAIWVSPDKMARFTVLTDRVIRMEYAARPNEFEDRELR